VRGQADVSALATRDARSVSVLVFHYHDDDLEAPPADVELTITGLPNGRAMVTHGRVDREHGNSYEKWKALGSPQPPTPAQYAELERASTLAPLAPPSSVQIRDGKLVMSFSLPRQGVSLVRATW
jgi:xylan 1,4-beta-xylosidase